MALFKKCGKIVLQNSRYSPVASFTRRSPARGVTGFSSFNKKLSHFIKVNSIKPY